MTETDPKSEGTLPPITDSPWFWGMLFCIFGIAIVMIGGKRISGLQTRDERDYQVKLRTDRIRAGDTSNLVTNPTYSTEENRLVDMWPVYLLFGTLGAICWWRFVRTRGILRPRAMTES